MQFIYTLPQKKRNFNFQIFYGDPGPGSVTPGHFTEQFQKGCVSFGEGCTTYISHHTVTGKIVGWHTYKRGLLTKFNNAVKKTDFFFRRILAPFNLVKKTMSPPSKE